MTILPLVGKWQQLTSRDMTRPEMPKSFLKLIYLLVVIAVPLFFVLVFVTSGARKRKRQKAALDAQLDALNIPLRNRCETILEVLRTDPASGVAGATLRELVQAELDLLNRGAAAGELCRAEAGLERALSPWLATLPDSYAKRKLLPLEAQVTEAKARYSDLANLMRHSDYPAFEDSPSG